MAEQKSEFDRDTIAARFADFAKKDKGFLDAKPENLFMVSKERNTTRRSYYAPDLSNGEINFLEAASISLGESLKSTNPDHPAEEVRIGHMSGAPVLVRVGREIVPVNINLYGEPTGALKSRDQLSVSMKLDIDPEHREEVEHALDINWQIMDNKSNFINRLNFSFNGGGILHSLRVHKSNGEEVVLLALDLQNLRADLRLLKRVGEAIYTFTLKGSQIRGVRTVGDNQTDEILGPDNIDLEWFTGRVLKGVERNNFVNYPLDGDKNWSSMKNLLRESRISWDRG